MFSPGQEKVRDLWLVRELWKGLHKYLKTTVELQWLEHLWNHENMFETGVVRANECVNQSARPGGIIGIHFRLSLI